MALAAWLPDERQDKAVRTLARLGEATALVPPVWELEVANALLIAERRGRLEADTATRIIDLMMMLPVLERRAQVDTRSLMTAAREYGITTYDASYLMLARAEDVPLATLDEGLARACRAAQVRLFPG